MSSDFWAGSVEIAINLITVTLGGLATASMQGGGWSSLQSASGGA